MIGKTVHKMEPSAQVFLFGSRARGTARNDSDWDVLILVDSPKVSEEQHRMGYELWLKGLELGQQINSIIYTQEQWKNGKPSLFRYNVNKEGISI